jgi:hypothetical protein
MRNFLIAFALAVPLAALAQPVQKPETGAPAAGAAPGTPAASPQYGQGGSPHCDKLRGAERDQCLKDEGAKTDSKGPSDSSTSGATAEPKAKSDQPAKKSSY